MILWSIHKTKTQSPQQFPHSPSRRLRMLVASVGIIMSGLSACSSLSGDRGEAAETRLETTSQPGTLLAGRLAIRAAKTSAGIGSSMSAGFELRGGETQGSLRLFSPLGTTLADAHWTAAGVLLRTDGQLRSFSSLDEMAQEVFGQDLPLRALWYWLNGLPWPQAEASPLPDEEGFSQLGWQVHTRQLAGAGQLLAQRDGPPGQAVLRIRLDR